MSAYLYPELKSKAAYKRAIAAGEEVFAVEQNVIEGSYRVDNGSVPFEGPHYPKPHTYYGTATVKDGKVVAVK